MTQPSSSRDLPALDALSRPSAAEALSHPPVLAIRAQGLAKTYCTYRKPPGLMGAIKSLVRRDQELTHAAIDIDLEVYEGELVGFVGPNGAGKTTTLKMLAGLLHPTAGSASVLGFTPWERPLEFRRQFALVLGQKNQLWWDLPAHDSLELNSRIYGISTSEFERTLSELTEIMDVRDKLNVMVRELSLGERMKMELIAALLHRPKVLFLDEPTIGLDVVAQTKVREFLKAYNTLSRTTILLTSHCMADIQALCKRVVIIDHGQIIYDGALADIMKSAADYKMVKLQFESAAQAAMFQRTQTGEVLEVSPTELCVRVKRNRLIDVCKQLLSQTGVADISIEDAPIEAVFSEIFTRTSHRVERPPAYASRFRETPLPMSPILSPSV